MEPPRASAEAPTVRVVDQQGKPVEGAHVATNAEFRIRATVHPLRIERLDLLPQCTIGQRWDGVHRRPL